MLALGVDPDLHRTAFAAVDEKDVLHWYCATQVPDYLKGDAAVARLVDAFAGILNPAEHQIPIDVDVILIEGQEFYRDSPVDANDLLKLARAAGAAALACKAMWPKAFLTIVPPKVWTGQRDKSSRHRHLYTHSLNHPSFNEFVRRPNMDMVHLMDAAGLAVWAHGDSACSWFLRERARRRA